MPFPLLPVIAGGASLLSGLFGNKAKSNQAKEQADLYNNWLKQYMNTGQGLFQQAQAGGWNPFGPQTSTSSQTGSTQGGSSFSNRPVITKEYQPLDELMRGIMTGRLSSPSSMPAGYASNRARAINESFAGADAAARNMAARRGLSGEQSYALASPVANRRAGALADMRGEIPLLEREMQNQDIGITQGLQSAFGTGQQGSTSTWGQSQHSGSQTNPFSASDLSALMRVLAPPSPQQGSQTGTSGVATGLDSLGALLGFLSSQKGNGGMSAYEQNPALWQGIGNASAAQGGWGGIQWSTPGTVMGPGGYPIATSLGGGRP